MSREKMEPSEEGNPFMVYPIADEEENFMAILSTVVSLIKARRKRILLVASVCGILTGGIAYLLPSKFTATASFIPPSNSGSSAAAALAGQLAGGASGLLGMSKTSGDLYVGILKSRAIASDLVERFHLKKVYGVPRESMVEKVLGSHTEFTSGSKDTIVTISVTEKDPVLARDLANAYLDELRATSGSLAPTENSQRRKFFEQRLALEKDELANAEVALKQGQEKSGLISPTGQTSTQINAIAQLRAQVAGKEVQLAALRQDESDENPDILRVKSELASLRSQIEQMERGTRSQSGAIPTAEVPALELEYIRLQRDVKYHETLFDILARQYEAARLDEAHDATLEVLDRAVTPDTKSGPHRILLTGAGFLAGLFFACLWVLIKATSSGEFAGSPRPASVQVTP